MGLCKCPKRKVTNQFCFEHRVNVCEHCMVQKHPKCIVQSYLNWLQDSDYDPKCLLCNHELSDDPCVRLVCYHVFHWSCLDNHCRQLGADTAPAGYTCPSCHECIFPPDNLVSPVADTLRKRLQEVNWARAGLGMPLLEERIERRPDYQTNPPTGPRPTPEGESARSLDQDWSNQVTTSSDNVSIQFDTSATSRKQVEPSKLDFLDASLATSPLLTDPDCDDNKYKRRSASDWLARWFRSVMTPSARRRQTKLQRYLMIAVIVVVAFLTLVVVFSYLGRSGGYEDPMLEPMNNPNIRVNDHRK